VTQMDLTGMVFGSWTVLSKRGRINGNTQYWCRCVCDAVHSVGHHNLRRGGSLQCRACAARQRSERARLTRIARRKENREVTTYIDAARDALLDQYPELEKKQGLMDLYLLLVLVKGEDVTLQDVHDAWGIWRSRVFPGHHDLVPFDELTPEVQAKDLVFTDRIAAAAQTLKEMSG
jgi:hypothetical protein